MTNQRVIVNQVVAVTVACYSFGKCLPNVGLIVQGQPKSAISDVYFFKNV